MNIISYALFCSAFLFLGGVAEAGCKGNACAVAYLTKQGGCMTVVNNGDKPVQFSSGVGHSPTVYPKSSEKILTIQGAAKGNGECMTSCCDNHTINFKN
jgi:hypothetical protein